MTSATVHQLPARTAPALLRLVAPDAVPPGAVIVGHVVATAPPGSGPGLALLAGTTLSIPALAAPALTAATVAGLVVDVRGRRVVADGAEVPLTRREFELLAHLVNHPDRVFTRGQLLAAVWDLPALTDGSRRTVDVHVSRVRRKLGAHGHALQSLRGVGYRWVGRAELRDGDR